MSRKKTTDDSVPNIKEAAVTLFAAKGYANTSLEEIANKAGFTKGAVYYYFKSKEALLLEILQDIESRSVNQTIELTNTETGGIVDKLSRFIALQARWAVRYPNDLAILMLTSIETANNDNKVSDRVRAIYDKMEKYLHDIVEDAKRHGEIAEAVSTKDLVLTFMATHDGNMLLWYRSGRRPEVGRLLTAAAKHAVLDKLRILTESAEGVAPKPRSRGRTSRLKTA